MLSNAYFLAKFRFNTAENEPAKNLQNFANYFSNFANFPNFPDLPLSRTSHEVESQLTAWALRQAGFSNFFLKAVLACAEAKLSAYRTIFENFRF